jgi:hypothetical protein
MARFFRDNGLTIALVVLFVGSLLGHWLAGAHFNNEELVQHGKPPISAIAFLKDPLFVSSIFENWESEFLQMSAYVVLTAMLVQRGSAESNDPNAPPRDAEKTAKSRNPNVPAAMRMGIVARWLYARSLGITLFILFVASFTMHWIFSARAAAAEAVLHGDVPKSLLQHLTSAQLWFESFQNWQSEFLSTAVLIVLSIWLRQRGSPESKPVAAPNSQTGA